MLLSSSMVIYAIGMIPTPKPYTKLLYALTILLHHVSPYHSSFEQLHFFKLFQLLHTQNDALRCNMSGENEKHMFFQHLVSSILGFPKNTDLRIRISNRLY